MMDMRPIINKMLERRYSQRTIDCYCNCLTQFFRRFSTTTPKDIQPHHLDEFFIELVKKGYSISTQNQYINAIKFYFEQMLGRPRTYYKIERPRKQKRLPEVLSKGEVVALLGRIRNLKHKAMISLVYSTGMRCSELTSLRISDIDSKRMVINIRQSKGAKDRQLPLSTLILEMLRKYYKMYRPEGYLFNGKKGFAYSQTSVRVIIKRAAGAAKIKKKVTTHTLRHSYATHLLESGLDLRYIQQLLGHSSSKTTEIYTHLSRSKFQQLRSPFDDLEF